MGHFGLQGIRERINQFGGEMSIKSEIGNGTKVTIAILMKGINNGEESS
jgi:signal transduction histidine kinase